MKLFIDFETCSELDVTEVGVYRYVEHASTRIRLLGWAVDSGPIRFWMPGSHFPDELTEAVQRATIHTWNAQFERIVWDALIPNDLPKPTFNQWRCIAAQARTNGLPGQLKAACRVLDLITTKLASKPHWFRPGSLTMDDAIDLMQYCEADVDAARYIHNLIPEMSDNEQFIYQLNEHVNDRGVRIDVAFAERMSAYVQVETANLNVELAKLTVGGVTAFTQVGRIKEQFTRWEGPTPESLDKDAIRGLLAMTLDPRTHRMLEIRQLGAKSSNAKYEVMLRSVCRDGRLHGMFMFAGAGQTGRFSSTGVQLHNLVRLGHADAEERIAFIKERPPREYRLMYDEPIMDMASKLIRPTLIPAEGKVFVIGDYSGVEARGLPWLAGKQEEVDEWAAGVDKYVDDACDVFNLEPDEVDDRYRQMGKVIRLACGFGGRGGALLAMAEGYGITLTNEEAFKHAAAWHQANPWVERYGRALERAAMCAVANPGILFPVQQGNTAPKVTYGAEHMAGVLVLRCQLPSGRVISYHDVRAEQTPYGMALSSVKPRETTRERLWYGTFLENVDQATCNDLLRFSMMTLQAAGLPVVAHVHDEHVVETYPNDTIVAQVKGLLEEPPAWAATFPLVAKVVMATRYQK